MILRSSSARLALAVAAGLFLAPARAPAAGSYDPDVEYGTLTTPHFHVVHAKGYEHIAIRTASIAESLLPYLTGRYGYTLSDRTTIVLDDQTDFANGSASVLPNKLITVFVTAPTEVSGLEDYDDWLETVLVHELAHVFHLDMVWGLPWVGRLLFGKYVSLNQYTPAFITEGLAVYEETTSSGSGRGRSSYVDMVLRIAALEDRFPSIDQGFRSFSNWPFSNVAYFVGGRFQQWVAEKYGEEALMHYHRAYASTPIPYVTWLAADIAFDASLESLWLGFEEDVKQEAALTLKRVKSSTPAMSEPERLTRYGGDLLGPRITPDGRSVIFSTSSPKDGARVHRLSLESGADEVLIDDTFSKAISFTADGRAFYFQQTEINQRYYFHNSVLRYELADESIGKVEVLEEDQAEFLAPSGSLRARDPDVSPDGRRLVFVQTPYAANRLVLAWLESDGVTIHPKVIVPAEPDVQLSNPRFSPDGQRIAVSRFRGGRRDVVIYDLRGTLLTEVTRDRAQDIDPTWSPDGRWLLFSSDRSGIYDLYAYEPATDTLRRLTNLIGGAYQPSVSPDGKMMVFRGYSVDGFDVYRLPFDPERAPRVSLAREAPLAHDEMPRRWPPTHPDRPSLPPPAPFKDTPLPETLPEGWALERYSALDTLLPIHDNWNLLPLVAANERELFIELTHFGQDALETQRYLAFVNYGTATQFVGGGASYTFDRLEPSFTLTGLTDVRTYALRDVDGRYLADYDEQRWIGALAIAIPLYQRHLLSVSYIFEHRFPWRTPAQEVLDLAAGLPAGGNFARVQLGYAYNNTRLFPHSVSLERGFSAAFALDALSRGVGSDYEQVVASGEVRYYWTLPFKVGLLQNNVLASRLAGVISGGPDLAALARLGGVAGSSPLTTTTQDFYPLRGMSLSALAGSALINGTVEYRAPLLRVERGLGTAPAVLRVLHLALFADFGRVFERLDVDLSRGLGPALSDFFSDFSLGVGGELRADVLLGYLLPLELRLGYAHLIVSPSSELDGSGPYFQIGSTF